jgi:exosome complex exonuclease DIS3/RRP44
LTNDKENLGKALAENLLASSLKDYFKDWSEYPELYDMVASSSPDDQEKATFAYREHLSATQMSAGLKSKVFYQGSVNISAHNYLEVSSILNT